MSLRSRRILFACFVLVFLLLVPIVLMYATGHRVNWRRLNLEKTASIIIASEPETAAVFLNNEPARKSLFDFIATQEPETTPARLKDVLPGEYVVKLASEGYWPWEERLLLSPGEAFNFGTIRLYKQSKPELILEARAQLAKSSPDGTALALIEDNILSITDTKSTVTETFTIPVQNKATIIWSADASRLLVGTNVINRSSKSIQNLSFLKDASIVRWNRLDSSIIYFLKNKELHSYSISSNKDSIISLAGKQKNQTIVDFNISGRQAHIIVRSEAGVDDLLIGQLDSTLELIDLPTAQYHFIENNFERPLLANGKKVYAIDQPLPLFPQPRLLEISSNFSSGRALNSSIVYATPLELRRWDREQEEYMLTRFSSPINIVWPLTKSAATIAALSDGLRLYVNGREPFILTLTPATDISELAVTTDEKFIYFVGTLEGRSGLFKLAL